MKFKLVFSLLISLGGLFWYAYWYPDDLLFALGLASVFAWMSLVSLLQTDLDYKGRERHTVGMGLASHLRVIKATRFLSTLIILSYVFLGSSYVRASDLWSGNLPELEIIFGVFYFLLTGLSVFYTLVFSFFDLRQILLNEDPYRKEYDLKHKKFLGVALLFLPFGLIFLLSLIQEAGGR